MVPNQTAVAQAAINRRNKTLASAPWLWAGMHPPMLRRALPVISQHCYISTCSYVRAQEAGVLVLESHGSRCVCSACSHCGHILSSRLALCLH